MRSVLFIVYTLRFWYKTDMHILTIFLKAPKNGYFITGEPDAKISLRGQEHITMLKSKLVFKRVQEQEVNFSDAFCEYLDEVYYPGAQEFLSLETVKFEYNNFFNSYAK